MNKRMIDELIPIAYDVLADVESVSQDESGKSITNKIVNNGVIDKKFRSQISAFGASIATSSLPAAISFFSKQGGSDVPRELLIKAICELNKRYKNVESTKALNEPVDLFNYVNNAPNKHEIKEKIINCAIALKLAMNLYKLKEEKPNESKEV